jgi:hypothetical protein
MSIYRTDIASARAPGDVFDYLARFSNASGWDPSVVSAEELAAGAPRVGSTYRLHVAVLGRRLPLDYRITELDRPGRVVLRAENPLVVSTDVITVRPGQEGGSVVSYEAILRAKGPGRLLSPFLATVLRRLGDRAAAGLARALGGPEA